MIIKPRRSRPSCSSWSYHGMLCWPASWPLVATDICMLGCLQTCSAAVSTL